MLFTKFCGLWVWLALAVGFGDFGCDGSATTL